MAEITEIDKRIAEIQTIVTERARDAEWVSAGGTEKSCIDGRGKELIIGVPGGDAGLLIAAPGAAHKLRGRLRSLSKDEISRAIDLYKAVVGNGKFYFHTDHHAHEPKPGQGVGAGEVGCGHIKRALTHVEYGVPPVMVSQVMELLNEKATVEEQLPAERRGMIKIILNGDHKEECVIVVETGELSKNSQVPALKPVFNGRQAFVYHPGVARLMIKVIAEHINEIVPWLEVNATNFEDELMALFEKQKDLTVRALAGSLPVFKVKITQNEQGNNEVRVSQ